MPKPIKLTNELMRQMIAEFEECIKKVKMTDGSVKYSKNFTYKEDTEKATVMFTPVAFAKMLRLLSSFDSEVAWHGVGKRIEGANFMITDIVVYPQTVTGSTVEMDTESYAKWLQENDEDERFNNIIMQGHSHVNAGTSPSAVDITHQEEILAQLTDDMFYIFMIWNKKLDRTIKIYDLENNTLYENGDVTCEIISEDADLGAFIEDAKELVQKKVTAAVTHGSGYAYGGNYGGYGSYGSYGGGKKTDDSVTDIKSKQKQKGKSDVGGGWGDRGYEDMDDYAKNFVRT